MNTFMCIFPYLTQSYCSKAHVAALLQEGAKLVWLQITVLWFPLRKTKLYLSYP